MSNTYPNSLSQIGHVRTIADIPPTRYSISGRDPDLEAQRPSRRGSTAATIDNRRLSTNSSFPPTRYTDICRPSIDSPSTCTIHGTLNGFPSRKDEETQTARRPGTPVPEAHGSDAEHFTPRWNYISKPMVQMIVAACLAVAIGILVAATVEEVPEPVQAVLLIPGNIWLRALKCVVVPLILSSLILAVQRLKQMSGHGARIATWTLAYYLGFMLIAIGQATVATALGWQYLFVRVQPEDQEFAGMNPPNSTNTTELAPHEVVVQVFDSLIPENIVEAIAADQRLLSVMVIALATGYLLRPSSMFIKVVKEVEELVAAAVTFLVRIAPLGVFFLILPNLFVLPIRAIGRNLGVLIGACLAGMVVHLFVVVSIVFVLLVRANPWSFWLRIAPAWIEAWGSGSSAATLPVTIECVLKEKVPVLVTKFVVPLGVLINMDGTALYFPIAVSFMAVTQGINLSAGDYVIVALLSTLSTIGASPIPGSALVFVVMICGAIHVPVTSMYAVIVAIDWFIDRFRTALNASGDAFAAKVIAKMTGFHDGDEAHHHNVDAEEYGEMLIERVVEGHQGRHLRRIGSTLTI